MRVDTETLFSENEIDVNTSRVLGLPTVDPLIVDT